jgi:tetratricopeptide (TPR) repeat protein
VLASHYQEAIRADPDAADVDALRASARERLTAAGQAAASLALGSEADRYFGQAAELSSDGFERAQLLEQAGRALWRSGDAETAEVRLREAIKLHEQNGRTSGGPAAVTLATAIATEGRPEDARGLIERFLAREPNEGDVILRAQAQAALANWLTLEGDRNAEADALFVEALETLERARELPALAEAMARRGVFLQILGRLEEALAVTSHARRLAEQHDVPAVALRATFTQVAVLLGIDQHLQALGDVERGLELARERGDRTWERMMLSELIQCHVFLGRWDEWTVRLLPEMLISEHDAVTNFLTGDAMLVAAARGDDRLLERCIALASPNRDAADPEFRAMARVTLAREAIERGRLDEVVELLKSVVVAQGISGELRSSGYALATDAALRGSNHAAISELLTSLERLEPVEVTPVRLAQRARLQAEQAHLAGDRERTAVEERRAVDLLRSVDARSLIADAMLDSVRRGGDPEALAQARTIYEELGATAWLARLETGLEVTA